MVMNENVLLSENILIFYSVPPDNNFQTHLKTKSYAFLQNLSPWFDLPSNFRQSKASYRGMIFIMMSTSLISISSCSPVPIEMKGNFRKSTDFIRNFEEFILTRNSYIFCNITLSLKVFTGQLFTFSVCEGCD